MPIRVKPSVKFRSLASDSIYSCKVYYCPVTSLVSAAGAASSSCRALMVSNVRVVVVSSDILASSDHREYTQPNLQLSPQSQDNTVCTRSGA